MHFFVDIFFKFYLHEYCYCHLGLTNHGIMKIDSDPNGIMEMLKESLVIIQLGIKKDQSIEMM